jgi:hypothetical protein
MLLSTSEFPVCQMVSMDYKKRYLKTQETPGIVILEVFV